MIYTIDDIERILNPVLTSYNVRRPRKDLNFTFISYPYNYI